MTTFFALYLGWCLGFLAGMAWFVWASRPDTLSRRNLRRRLGESKSNEASMAVRYYEAVGGPCDGDRLCLADNCLELPRYSSDSNWRSIGPLGVYVRGGTMPPDRNEIVLRWVPRETANA